MDFLKKHWVSAIVVIVVIVLAGFGIYKGVCKLRANEDFTKTDPVVTAINEMNSNVCSKFDQMDKRMENLEGGMSAVVESNHGLKDYLEGCKKKREAVVAESVEKPDENKASIGSTYDEIAKNFADEVKATTERQAATLAKLQTDRARNRAAIEMAMSIGKEKEAAISRAIDVVGSAKLTLAPKTVQVTVTQPQPTAVIKTHTQPQVPAPPATVVTPAPVIIPAIPAPAPNGLPAEKMKLP